MTYQLPRNVVGWIYNHSRKNYWRVAPWYDLEDLVQDGIMKAYKCVEKYGVPGVDLDEPHFMRLVQSSFYSHIGELLRGMRIIDDSTKLADLAATENEAVDLFSKQDPVSDFDFAALLSDLPAHLRKAVNLFLSDEDAKELRRPMRQRLSDSETIKDRLFKLAGFPMELDFETELRAFLWERRLDLV